MSTLGGLIIGDLPSLGETVGDVDFFFPFQGGDLLFVSPMDVEGDFGESLPFWFVSLLSWLLVNGLGLRLASSRSLLDSLASSGYDSWAAFARLSVDIWTN